MGIRYTMILESWQLCSHRISEPSWSCSQFNLLSCFSARVTMIALDFSKRQTLGYRWKYNLPILLSKIGLSNMMYETTQIFKVPITVCICQAYSLLSIPTYVWAVWALWTELVLLLLVLLCVMNLSAFLLCAFCRCRNVTPPFSKVFSVLIVLNQK